MVWTRETYLRLVDCQVTFGYWQTKMSSRNAEGYPETKQAVDPAQPRKVARLLVSAAHDKKMDGQG
jgi:hypothetical protein